MLPTDDELNKVFKLYKKYCNAGVYEQQRINMFDFIRKIGMDKTVIKLVTDYVLSHLDKSDKTPEFEVYTVWKCKILQNWKYLCASTLPDGMYYELTYDGDKNRWYLDAYKKFDNQCLTVGKLL